MRWPRGEQMSAYCKWDHLQETMLKGRHDVQFYEGRLRELKEEFKEQLMQLPQDMHFHDDRVHELKERFRAKRMHRESQLAYWNEQLATATARFKEQDDIVRWHEKMLGLW